MNPRRPLSHAFTLIELLVVISIIAILIAVLVPALSGVRQTGVAAKCLTQLRTLGEGQAIYGSLNDDVMVPDRLPKLDSCNWYMNVPGGQKFRPNFLVMLGAGMDLKAFEFIAPCETGLDAFGEPADQQNFSNPVFVCPACADWTDERNTSYGYNYQFLGDARLAVTADPNSFKYWPIPESRLHDASQTVVMADTMGTAANYAAKDRMTYLNNDREKKRMGNNGFDLDPPRVDPAAGLSNSSGGIRSGVDPRHRNRANVLWADGHADADTPETLGYQTNPDGSIRQDGNNSLWSGSGKDVAWTPAFHL